MGLPSRGATSGLLLLTLAGAALPTACVAQTATPLRSASEAVDSARVLEDLRLLSSPAMEGRATGTPGNEMARVHMETSMRAAGLRPLLETGFRQAFPLAGGAATDVGSAPVGANVLGQLPGTERARRYIILTAHFDHLGIRDGAVYPGADDNASGSAALLELARYFSMHPPRTSIIFAALDGEEGGLRGARHFVQNPPIPLDSIALVINMDMIGRNDQRELFVAGTHHYPFLNPIVDAIASESRLTIRKGHDRPDGSAGDDWTQSSDHGPFHTAGVPFLYFGVEDHADYHRPSDTFDGIQPDFYVEAVRTILQAALEADARTDELIEAMEK